MSKIQILNVIMIVFCHISFWEIVLQQSQNKLVKNANIQSPIISNKHDFTEKYTDNMNIK